MAEGTVREKLQAGLVSTGKGIKRAGNKVEEVAKDAYKTGSKSLSDMGKAISNTKIPTTSDIYNYGKGLVEKANKAIDQTPKDKVGPSTEDIRKKAQEQLKQSPRDKE